MLPELRPDILLEAYAEGLFPMAGEDGEIMWFSPDPRAIIPLDGFHVSGNLRRRCESGRFTVTVDQAFDKVITCCADREDGTWISADMIEAYTRLHELHHVHSVETWLEGQLAGGLYGVTLGGAFFGESMFHRRTDASKVAMVFLVERMAQRGFSLLDIQFMTDHLARFGAIEIPRSQYLERLDFALSGKCVFAD
ncbi:MAG: leucyl/phenylalanyl-tRNA--protein transferase [Phycisphaerae bacterium]